MSDWLKPEQRDKLKRRLDDIPDLVTLVETMHATRMPRRSTGGGTKPHPASRPPVNLGIVDLLDTRPKLNGRTVVDTSELVDRVEAELWAAKQREDGRAYTEDGKAKRADPTTVAPEAKGRRVGILLCLESWVRIAAEEMAEAGEEHTPPREPIRAWAASIYGVIGPVLLGGPTVSSEAGWLSQHVEWIAGQQWSLDLNHEVAAIWKDLRRTAGERAEYRPRCPDCRALLTGRAGFWECGACGRDYRDERMLTSCQKPMTGERIAQLFGINYSTIRVWHHRGRLEPAVGEDGLAVLDGKRPTFHVIDILRLVDAGGAEVGARREGDAAD